MKRPVLTRAWSAALWTFAGAQGTHGADTLFRCDGSVSRDRRDSLIEATHSRNVYDVCSRISRIGQVAGYLITQSEKGCHAGILSGHLGPGDGAELLPEAALYAQAGVVSSMIEHPWVREMT